MGEYAEMMIDGTMCAGCGVYLRGEGIGFPRHCRDCAREVRDHAARQAPAKPQKTPCPKCGKWVKLAGLADHQRAAHKEEAK